MTFAEAGIGAGLFLISGHALSGVLSLVLVLAGCRTGGVGN